MPQHLMLNQQRLETAETISDEIEEYWEAMEEFNKDAKDSPAFVAPVKQGAPNNSGEGAPKSEGNVHKGLGYQPQRGEQGKCGGYCKRVHENIKSE